MTVDEALEIQLNIDAMRKTLAKEFPCPECDGTGDLNSENMPYRNPCDECGGTGYRIPDEEAEQPFAEVSWCATDIQEHRHEWSVDRCMRFLDDYEDDIQGAMIEAGGDAIIRLLSHECD
jgi:RecJ-like exonuclease